MKTDFKEKNTELELAIGLIMGYQKHFSKSMIWRS